MSQVKSICVYCGSSDDVKPEYLELARATGTAIARAGIRMVYGGGGVGLMGEAARSAHEAGGDVLGIMPRFLLAKERMYKDVEHVIVDNMHIRKQMMFDRSDAFIVLPGGIGTLEEAVEMLSWQRLGLHAKPMAFLDEDGFWTPFFDLMDRIIEGKFTPENFRDALVHTTDPNEAIEALQDRQIAIGE